MKNITVKNFKDLWIKFYTQKGHTQIAPSSLVPENDASVLFTTAGMQPLVPYLLGQQHPQGTRLVNYQACLRTNDIESVGDATHLTFFEMLGRWSLGDYDKLSAIEMTYEFLTSPDYLGLKTSEFAVSVFAGGDGLPQDTQAYEKWNSLGMPKEHIFYLPKENNWWALGEVGPCGPDSEFFFITDVKHEDGTCSPACDCGKYVEFGNDVFMSYYKDEHGTLTELKNKNIDTGLGVERNVMVFNGYKSVYETDAFKPVMDYLQSVLPTHLQSVNAKTMRAMRIIADHLRATVMVLGDPTITVPSNVGRGYVLRRLIRRALRYQLELELTNPDALQVIANMYIKGLGEYYPTLLQKQTQILDELQKEIVKFDRTIRAGIREVKKVLDKLQGKVLDGKTAFRLYDTFGFPIELTVEYVKDFGVSVDMAGYNECYAEHQQKSKGNNDQVFKSGLAGTGGVYNRYHTATHLLHAVLRQMFGEATHQAGSAITEDKMRFDFTFERKLTPEEVMQVQDGVNEYIKQALPVTRLELGKQEAREIGAFGIFDDKYGDVVSVYTIGNPGHEISKEFCTGPHVSNTSEIGHFKIVKEESSSAGVRRIKAIVE